MISRKDILPSLPLGEENNYPLSLKPSKKQRRSTSPMLRKKNRKSQSHSPVSRKKITGILTEAMKMTGESSTSGLSETRASHENLDIKVIGPTSHGISEAGRIILSPTGILAFPTETLYCMSTYIPFQRPVKTQNGPINLPDPRSSLWEKALSIHSRPQFEETLRDGPFLFLDNPLQARQFISLGRPKTVVCKQASQDSECNDTTTELKNHANDTTLTAVTFVESIEVLNRLSSAFWPGPVSIFAPVRTRSPIEPKKARNEDNIAATNSNSLRRGSTGSSNSDFSSTSSLNSLISIDSGANAPGSVPIFPTSALASKKSLRLEAKSEEDSYFVGMRCSAHPLTRCVLKEAYGKRTTNRGKACVPNPANQRVRGAVFGFTAYKKLSPLPVTANDVSSNLLSESQTNDLTMNNIIHVLNGEDKHEIFHAPACQFGKEPGISLVIDIENRTVVLLHDRKKEDEQSSTSRLAGTGTNVNVTLNDVQRALYLSNDDGVSIKSKVVATVMRRWKVVEKKN